MYVCKLRSKYLKKQILIINDDNLHFFIRFPEPSASQGVVKNVLFVFQPKIWQQILVCSVDSFTQRVW